MADTTEILDLIERAGKNGLKELDLSGRQLTSLPPRIAKLTNLTFLKLDNDQSTTDHC